MTDGVTGRTPGERGPLGLWGGSLGDGSYGLGVPGCPTDLE